MLEVTQVTCIVIEKNRYTYNKELLQATDNWSIFTIGGTHLVMITKKKLLNRKAT